MQPIFLWVNKFNKKYWVHYKISIKGAFSNFPFTSLWKSFCRFGDENFMSYFIFRDFECDFLQIEEAGSTYSGLPLMKGFSNLQLLARLLASNHDSLRLETKMLCHNFKARKL